MRKTFHLSTLWFLIVVMFLQSTQTYGQEAVTCESLLGSAAKPAVTQVDAIKKYEQDKQIRKRIESENAGKARLKWFTDILQWLNLMRDSSRKSLLNQQILELENDIRMNTPENAIRRISQFMYEFERDMNQMLALRKILRTSTDQAREAPAQTDTITWRAKEEQKKSWKDRYKKLIGQDPSSNQTINKLMSEYEDYLQYFGKNWNKYYAIRSLLERYIQNARLLTGATVKSADLSIIDTDAVLNAALGEGDAGIASISTNHRQQFERNYRNRRHRGDSARSSRGQNKEHEQDRNQDQDRDEDQARREDEESETDTTEQDTQLVSDSTDVNHYKTDPIFIYGQAAKAILDGTGVKAFKDDLNSILTPGVKKSLSKKRPNLRDLQKVMVEEMPARMAYYWAEFFGELKRFGVFYILLFQASNKLAEIYNKIPAAKKNSNAVGKSLGALKSLMGLLYKKLSDATLISKYSEDALILVKRHAMFLTHELSKIKDKDDTAQIETAQKIAFNLALKILREMNAKTTDDEFLVVFARLATFSDIWEGMKQAAQEKNSSEETGFYARMVKAEEKATADRDLSLIYSRDRSAIVSQFFVYLNTAAVAYILPDIWAFITKHGEPLTQWLQSYGIW